MKDQKFSEDMNKSFGRPRKLFKTNKPVTNIPIEPENAMKDETMEEMPMMETEESPIALTINSWSEEEQREAYELLAKKFTPVIDEAELEG